MILVITLKMDFLLKAPLNGKSWHLNFVEIDFWFESYQIN
jgi:hypothetical protein